MKEVLDFIQYKKQEFAQLPLFNFMRDQSIDPKQRLAWAPCAAYFIMNFGELNKYFLRVEPTEDPLQLIINKHTYEDDHHWLWFLEDLKRLELDQSLKFSEALRFLWSEETEKSRWLTYQLYRHTLQATPIQKLIVIEVVETTGNVMFSTAADIQQELKSITHKECLYFADFHLAVETGHTTGLPGIEEFIRNIKLTEEARIEAYELVDKVFAAFTEFTHSLLTYAEKYQVQQLSNVA
ncbi:MULTISPECIES: hypothetical protein [unclassified Tolypothrix]|uniref:hypothetical protein n=1 Tax=unclassified Tolypothrix TaxID=2649714 RepID=UPI0005EAB88B|nr:MULTISPECIES: hypothetical protein [unclassified Tolypothrix]BAY93168.1 hypothetical protein NIES3275_52060 [Microchaete diplosiphon NIES-3275]EKF00435.1 hypothetical protein FDUTEX481_09098 [Tolypothrix sp. PCC 7601]MBE9085799.1 hypothetical protein [Tolypothrix sp. LEGE 11397]UYD27044.1 hypothetical protein HGR01_02745 [Tolypothrix sp. PCC 7712]UYD37098.1 hypothetical protein HG267_16030 [Tolypothrix sp. PCC 7601]